MTMKRYIAPAVTVQQITDNTALMAASPAIGGSTGVGLGTGSKPGSGTAGQAKRYNVWENRENWEE